ncbi:hypothetical protein KOI35_28540 [Actinoplanes bogorensis]|uniref:Roadblock/LAMTOR2 domain-containing protein n=1 Tax=Paractinoplanes bogorensis TaxID=1610840 RepID=A0ABS5YVJ3_9ACTN|nr:hypothetical protein [Actinoplanes bogorensis]MBU2667467.1 hypothetical protein [Actinoplanes bogorensis]
MPPLTEALGIPGAHAVSLIDPEGPRVLWWAGETVPTEQESAAAVTLAAAAAGLVLLDGNGGDELSDILLTSADAFHVLRLVGTEAPLVAHLTLRRTAANLAMARREFGTILTAYAREIAPLRSPALAPSPLPASTGSLPASTGALEAVLNGAASLDLLAREVGSGTVDLRDAIAGPDALLPQRNRNEPDETSDLLSNLLGQPYATDDEILDRVLVALRTL